MAGLVRSVPLPISATEARAPLPGLAPKRTCALRRTLWLAVYTAMALAPLAFVPVAAYTREQASFGTVLAAGLGFTGLTIMSLQLVTPSRVRPFTVPFGADLLLRFHRSIGTVTWFLVLGHIVVLMADDSERLGLLLVHEAPLRAQAGAVATLSLTLLVATSLWRKRFGLSYEGWRGAHILLGVLVLCGSIVHVLKVDKYLAVAPIRWSVIGLALGAVAALLALRITRPLRARRKAPYEVSSVRRERGDATTLELTPLGRPVPFHAGDFAWIKLGDRPLSLTEHPFSFSSSADRPERVSFTIKESGDFTSRVVTALERGTRVIVDGPHGSFKPADPDAPYLLIAGGIGITPAISTLRTFADRRDHREVVLLYLSRTWEDMTFREDLAELQRRLPSLRIVHVLSRPHEGWDGETGRICPELLERVLPLRAKAWNVFICASPAVTAAAHAALDAWGMPRRQVHAEHFVSV
jgi:predicted ferric reductase